MLVVGGASGSGANFNVVPNAAWFSVDRRFNPEEDLDEELERLTRMIEEAAGHAQTEVEVTVLQQQPSSATTYFGIGLMLSDEARRRAPPGRAC